MKGLDNGIYNMKVIWKNDFERFLSGAENKGKGSIFS